MKHSFGFRFVRTPRNSSQLNEPNTFLVIILVGIQKEIQEEYVVPYVCSRCYQKLGNNIIPVRISLKQKKKIHLVTETNKITTASLAGLIWRTSCNGMSHDYTCPTKERFFEELLIKDIKSNCNLWTIATMTSTAHSSDGKQIEFSAVTRNILKDNQITKYTENS